MKVLIVFFLSFCSLPLLANEADSSVATVFNEDSFNIRLDAENPVTFFGKINVNGGAGAGSMMYPGGDAATFLVSIMVHAAISGSVEKKRLSAEQVEANKVLLDYQPYIEKIDASFIGIDRLELAPERAVDLYFDPEINSSSKWSIRSQPIFFMTSTQKTLILYSQVYFQDLSLPKPKLSKRRMKKTSRRKSKKVDPNQKIVVIVSDPVSTEEAGKYWLDEDGKNFYNATKSMYHESLLLALQNHTGHFFADSNQVTVRYLENGEKKIERGAIIHQTCERTLFKTLSGEIKSVPNMEFLSCPVDTPVVASGAQ